jgi:hypothetical protein
MIGLPRPRQGSQQREHFPPVLQAAAGNLADDEGMAPDFRPAKEHSQDGVAPAQVVDPDGRVDEH